MKAKTTMRYYLTPVKIAKIQKTGSNKYWQGCEEQGHLCTVGGNVNYCSPCGKQYGYFLKSLEVELPSYTSIPPLGI